ncbi:hypothetical protein CC78DRAFT_570283 [Lojkania enalia]|uniref:IgE-binding protein n=1 Tax=Lojkania enalia TaxID=147567 RepID=A0A9P4K5A3_9PLEO|nr:hypothetical protein CC78DRAFT_570283 [Didymosphaeria enalia]
MMSSLHLLLKAVALLPIALGSPYLQAHRKDGPGLHTLTAYVPGDKVYDGLKVEYGGYLNLFQEKTGQYCPTQVQPNCPNGTELVFSGTFYPSSMVPGGQEFYVSGDGSTHITVQHSHAFPPGSYPYYYGWTWTSFTNRPAPSAACPTDDPLYNCDIPTGYFTFKAPDGPEGYEGGLKACRNVYDESVTSVYAVTPGFNLTGCVKMKGLATHAYSGVNPPVWAY